MPQQEFELHSVSHKILFRISECEREGSSAMICPGDKPGVGETGCVLWVCQNRSATQVTLPWTFCEFAPQTFGGHCLCALEELHSHIYVVGWHG